MELLLVIPVGFWHTRHEACFIAREPGFVCVNFFALFTLELGGGIVLGPFGGLRFEAEQPVMQ